MESPNPVQRAAGRDQRDGMLCSAWLPPKGGGQDVEFLRFRNGQGINARSNTPWLTLRQRYRLPYDVPIARFDGLEGISTLRVA